MTNNNNTHGKIISNYTFCIIIVNEPKVDHQFDDIAPNDTKRRLELIF